MRHPRRGSTLTRGVLVGGAGGALHVTFCPGSGAETAPRRPVPERSSSTLAGQDHHRVVPSGLTSRNFPSFGAETGSVTLLAVKIGRSREF
jgi:hypothetical protein